jgi:hypothetical protein
MTNAINKKNEPLSCELLDAQPHNFDFSEGYGESWDVPLDLTDEERNNEEFMPLMNYAYPLGEDFTIPADFRTKLENTTIVCIDEKYYLALTGGGMDMTWEIAESYINLGYYPPAHFCRLPGIAGRGTSARDRRIIEFCNEGLRTMIRWMSQRLEENKRQLSK